MAVLLAPDPLRVECDAGGCTVDPKGLPLTVECAAGNCAVRDRAATLQPCTGRCVVR